MWLQIKLSDPIFGVVCHTFLPKVRQILTRKEAHANGRGRPQVDLRPFFPYRVRSISPTEPPVQNRWCISALVSCLALSITSMAQTASPNSATFDSDGTARITRTIPMPSTVSPEAQKWLASLANKKIQHQTLAERR